MGLESATYIEDLNVANPTASDAKSDGDNHIRLLKTVLKNTFPNADAAINATVAEFNRLVAPTDLSAGMVAGTGFTITALKLHQQLGKLMTLSGRVTRDTTSNSVIVTLPSTAWPASNLSWLVQSDAGTNYRLTLYAADGRIFIDGPTPSGTLGIPIVIAYPPA